MIKHPIDEPIEESSLTVVLPVSAESRLRTGLFQRFARKDEAYRTLSKSWLDLDRGTVSRATMAERSGFFWPPGLPIIIIPVKQRGLDIPISNIADLTLKLAHFCRKRGVPALALARSTWENMRYTTAQYRQLVDALEQKGIEVHEYE